MNLPAGYLLGPYQIQNLIASGGMGYVYRARYTRLNRLVALKVLARGLTLDPGHLARFAQEARTTALLNHPNVVGIFDVGWHQGMPYVVSELLHGVTLRERLKAGPLPARVAIAYAMEIARGLIAAHDIDIVHRDLKPENIFITRDERLKILDFGLAKCRRDVLGLPQLDSSKSTQPGTILGTVGYMSPEQVRGVATDARSDIFTFGVILHEMLAGVAPFHGDSAIETLHAILKDDAPELAPGCECSPPLEFVVRHCLEKDPKARFQSARDLAFVLEFLVDRRQPPAPHVPAWRSPRGALRESIASLFEACADGWLTARD